VNEIEVEEGAPSEGSDLWLAAKVKTALLFSSNVSGLDTEVSAQNGVVTLKGVADTEAQKELTGKRAEDVKGVKSVANEIRVPGSEKPTTAKAADKAERIGEAIERGVDDASITAQAKMALLTSKSTSAIETDVDTERGVVTVTGEAANEAEKELVTELLKDIRGVKDVKNAMTVAPSS
ncbi:MAG: BON domain-containing protein, partial [Candidatus Methylomirabilis sp.]|nr:BON domain-containing protein [Deltaproteobacteria bacterium]